MAKYNPIIVTKAQFLADAAAHRLYRGEVYIIEDEPRLAIATSNSDFFMHVNLEDLMENHGTLPGGELHDAVTEAAAGFMTPDLLARLEDVEYILTTHDWSQAQVYWENIQNTPSFGDLAMEDDAPSDGKDYVRKDGDWVEVDALPDQAGNTGKVLTTDGTNANWEEISTGLNWVYADSGPVDITEGFTGIMADTTSGAFTVNLPDTPEEFDIVGFTDYAGTWDTYNLTISGNGNSVLDDTDMIADVKYGNFNLIYKNNKWVFA